MASRRAADRLIEEARVEVNGRVVRQLGTRIRPDRDAVRVDGKRISAPPSSHAYLLLNKPRGYVTTLSDPEGRPTIRDLMPAGGRRLFPVGRLDFHSEGLLLLTDDGELARDLTHPGRGVPKSYLVKVRGVPGSRALQNLRRGVMIDGRPTLPAQLRIVRRAPTCWLEVTIREGRKHQVRRMLGAVGHPVQRLKRVRLDGLELGSLAAGRVRPLTPAEVARLKRASRQGSSRRDGERPPRERRN